jgi:hypothetical protein
MESEKNPATWSLATWSLATWSLATWSLATWSLATWSLATFAHEQNTLPRCHHPAHKTTQTGHNAIRERFDRNTTKHSKT